MRDIYLDNSATTRICPEALAAYVEVSETHWGNPSSLHSRGVDAEGIMREVREDVKASIGATAGEVIFTSGGTEANNLAILGRALSKPRFARGGKIITTAGEHASVSHPIAHLAERGFRMVEIPTVGGRLDMDALVREMTPDVILVTMMLVNNESGAIYDLAAVSRLMKRVSPDGVLHVDATQAYMKIPFTVSSLGADMVTLSSHKIEGPKGIGALWVSPDMIRTRGITPEILGGGQEGGMRSGTENVPGIAAFGAAVRYRRRNFREHAAHLTALRERLLSSLSKTSALAEVKANIPPTAAPHIVSLTLPRIKSETMLHFLSSEGVYVSSGSACSSHDAHISSAMLSFGLSTREADTTIRVSFGTQNTVEDVDAFVDLLAAGVQNLIRLRK